MSEIKTPASKIGISPLSLTHIQSLSTFLQTLNLLPSDLASIHTDLTSIISKLPRLDLLYQADENTISEVQKTGVTNFINVCGPQCEKLVNILVERMKSGEEGWRDGKRVKADKDNARIENCGTGIWCAAKSLNAAVEVLELRVEVFNAIQVGEMAELIEKLDIWRREADERHAAVVRCLDEVDDGNGDGEDVDDVREELLDQDLALREFVERCHDMLYMLRVRKVHGGIGSN